MAILDIIYKKGTELSITIDEPTINATTLKGRTGNMYSLSVYDPEGKIKTITSDAFRDCAMDEVVLSNDIETIDNDAFLFCKINKITFPSKLTTLKNSVFMGNDFREITLPSTLKSIGEKCFASCNKLKAIHFADELKTIPSNVCSNCRRLKEVTLGAGTQEIKERSFYDCDIEMLTLPSTIEIVGAEAFASNTNLHTIAFSSGTKFDESAFDGTDKLSYKPIHLFHKDDKFVLSADTDLIQSEIEQGTQIFNLTELDKVLVGILKEPTEKKGPRLKDATKNRNFIQIMNNAEIIQDPSFTTLIETLNRAKVSISYNFIAELKAKNKLEEFVGQFNVKNYKLLINSIKKTYPNDLVFDSPEMLGLTKLAYGMGVFSSDAIISQKATEFLSWQLQTKAIPLSMFERAKGFNVENGYIADFSQLCQETRESLNSAKTKQNNLVRAMEQDLRNENFLTDTYNNFRAMQNKHISSKGINRRRLKLTLEDIITQLIQNVKSKIIDSELINEETQIRLSRHLSEMWLLKKDNLTECVKILEEFTTKQAHGKIKEDVTNSYITERSLPATISKLRSIAIDESRMAIEEFNLTALKMATGSRKLPSNDETTPRRQPYTFSAMKKNSVENFGSAKALGSCASIDDAGYGIMRAMIINPDCQNFEILDTTGNRVGKFNIYISRNKGYMLINSLYIKTPTEKLTKTDYVGTEKEYNKQITKERNEIIDCFIRGVNGIVMTYNAEELNSKKKKNATPRPLYQVNIGDSLYSGILKSRGYKEVSNGFKTFLSGIKFEKYERPDHEKHSYQVGDWWNWQYILYKDQKMKEAYYNEASSGTEDENQ